MKKYIYFLLALAASSLLLFSCKEEEQFQPGEPDVANCYGVYFPNQEATGAHTYDPTMDTSVDFTVSRTNTSGSITVPVTYTESETGMFQVGEINFADGQSETTLTVNFPTTGIGTTYSLSVTIDDEQYASKYSSNAISLDFSVLRVEWVNFLDPKTKEPAVLTLNEGWWGEVHTGTMKYYEVDGVRTCVISSNEEGNGIWGDDVMADLQFTWYTKNNNAQGNNYLKVPKQYFGFDYNDWASKPENQAVSPIYVYDYYSYWIERGESEATIGTWLEFAKNYGQIDGNYPVGYYDGNGGFYFNLRYYIPGLGGFSPDPYEFVAIASGFTRVDYSLELEGDYSYDGISPIYVEAGADVASIDYAVYAGELTATQVANKVAGIVAGTEEGIANFADFEYDEDEGKSYGAFAVAPETTGDYTLVAVAKDSEGKFHEDAFASVGFRHVAAGDVEDLTVDIDVFTEPTPARYKSMTEYDSFAFGIQGADITEAHIGVVATSKLNNSYLSDLKYKGTAVSDAVLSAINGEGGYYDVASGLDPGTEYAVVIWATNGYLDDFAYATFETTASPEVWAPLGTGVYTDDFFTTFFNIENLTWEVEVEQSQDDPTRYRMIYPYDGKYLYNEEGDWDESKSYDIVITIPDPEHVYIVPQEIGVNWGYGMVSICSQAGRYLAAGYDIATIEANNIPFGTLADGVITFPVQSCLISMANYNNGGWYYANTNGLFSLTLPANAAAASVKASSVDQVSRTVKSANAAPEVRSIFERDPHAVKASVSNLPNNRKEKESGRGAKVETKAKAFAR